MKRVFAAALAGVLSLALFAAVFAALSWFMHGTAHFWIAPRSARIIGVITSLFVSTVVVPAIIMRRGKSATEQQDSLKPAARLWARSLQRPEE